LPSPMLPPATRATLFFNPRSIVSSCMLEKIVASASIKHPPSKPLMVFIYNKMPAASMKGSFFIGDDPENVILKEADVNL
jgi:hypothetical protein